MVVDTVTVGAQNNALLGFFHSKGVFAVANQIVYGCCLCSGVYVVKIQRGYVIKPTFCAVQRGLVRLPVLAH